MKRNQVKSRAFYEYFFVLFIMKRTASREDLMYTNELDIFALKSKI